MGSMGMAGLVPATDDVASWVEGWRCNPVATPTEIAFVDGGLPALAALRAGLRPGVRQVLLATDRPAICQMAEALAGRRGLRAVHVLANGAPGRIGFAAGALDRAGLAGHARDLVTIGQALGSGTLHLWCCRTAAGRAGRAFVAALSALVCAPVAAATHAVGAATQGGQWSLDVRASARQAAQPASTSSTAPGPRSAAPC